MDFSSAITHIGTLREIPIPDLLAAAHSLVADTPARCPGGRGT